MATSDAWGHYQDRYDRSSDGNFCSGVVRRAAARGARAPEPPELSGRVQEPMRGKVCKVGAEGTAEQEPGTSETCPGAESSNGASSSQTRYEVPCGEAEAGRPSQHESNTVSAADDDDTEPPCCYICLEEGGPLLRGICACKAPVHEACQATPHTAPA